jgi:hypothetical protein
MQIHEITEGLLSNVTRGFASSLVWADIPQSQASIDRQAAQAAQQLRTQGYGKTAAGPGAIEKITVSLVQPGQSTPSKYIKTGTTWANELGTIITDLKQKAFLDRMIPTHGKKEVIPTGPVATNARKTVSRRRSTR